MDNAVQHTPLTDGHNDLPWAIRLAGGLDEVDLLATPFQTDVPRLRQSGVRAQFWPVFVPSGNAARKEGIDDPFLATCEQIDIVHRMAARWPRHLRVATTSRAISDAAELGTATDAPIASLLGAEGGHCISNSLSALRTLHRLGVRYLTLTHNDNNDWADSATDRPRHGGLTDFGRDVVREMNRLGMMVDLSHTAPTTMQDALDVSTAPVIFSHSSARAVTDHPRNVPDHILEQMAAGGGTCMVAFVTKFVKRRLRRHSKIDDVVRHINHVRDVAGVDHVGIGGDFDGTTQLPRGLEDVSGYRALFAALADAGWSRDDLAKLGWRNIARTFSLVEDASEFGV